MENSLAAIGECYREGAARVEIDVHLFGDDFVIAHDQPRRTSRVPFLRAALDIARESSGRTLLELDMKDVRPWPRPAVEDLARLAAPVKDRIVFTSPADWNLRRLLRADSTLPVGFDPQLYLDWTRRREELPRRRGAYGYLDEHPLAGRRAMPTPEYLAERLDALIRAVPGTREMHLRLEFFERMVRDGADVAAILHDAGVLVDVWTLDAGTRRWRERLMGAVDAGVDVVTTNTPRELAGALAPGA